MIARIVCAWCEKPNAACTCMRHDVDTGAVAPLQPKRFAVEVLHDLSNALQGPLDLTEAVCDYLNAPRGDGAEALEEAHELARLAEPRVRALLRELRAVVMSDSETLAQCASRVCT